MALFRHLRHPRAFHVIKLPQEFGFLFRCMKGNDSGGVFVIIKGSTVDVAGEETKGFGGLVVRHTPMVFVIARVSSCACACALCV